MDDGSAVDRSREVSASHGDLQVAGQNVERQSCLDAELKYVKLLPTRVSSAEVPCPLRFADCWYKNCCEQARGGSERVVLC